MGAQIKYVLKVGRFAIYKKMSGYGVTWLPKGV